MGDNDIILYSMYGKTPTTALIARQSARLYASVRSPPLSLQLHQHRAAATQRSMTLRKEEASNQSLVS